MAFKKKLVHVQLLPLMSGVQKVSLDELENLDQSVYEMIVVCKSEGQFTERLRDINVRVKLIPELERKISPIQDFRAFISLLHFFRIEQPDVVHTHSSKTGILGRFAAFFARVPMVIHTVHGFPFAGEKSLINKVFFGFFEFIASKFTNKIIVLNDSDAAIAKNQLHVTEGRLVILPNGVDINCYAPGDSHIRNNIRKAVFGIESDQHLIIAMIGRLWEQKNPQCFVRAAISVLKKRVNASFYLIGDGEARGELEDMILRSEFSDRIRILGWRSDIPDLLKALDVMVLPSRWEGMPLAILEAMSSSVPVVVSDIPGNHHLVRDGIEGMLFPVDDSEALSLSLVKLIENPALRLNISTQARLRVLSKYTLSTRIEKINSIYHNTF